MHLKRRNFLRLLALTSLLSGTGKSIASELATSRPNFEVDPLPEVLAPYIQLVGNPAATWICVPARNATQVSIEIKGEATRIEAFARHIRGTPWIIWHAPVPTTKPYRVVIDKNPHGDWRKIRSKSTTSPTRVAFINDIHDRTGTLALAANQLKPDNHDLVILLGDIFNDPSSKDGAERTFRTLHALASLLHADEVPLLYLPGNHDYRGSFADRIDDLFLAPRLEPSAHHSQGGVASSDQGWDFHFGPVALIAADTGEDFDKRSDLFHPLRERQVQTISDALTRAAQSPWRVFLSHIPIFSDDIWNSEDARQTWTPILTQGKVDLALAGHVHEWKIIPAGKEQVITFKPSPKDNQPIDSVIRYTPPFSTVIGGGPEIKRATVMLMEATDRRLVVRIVAAEDGRELTRHELQR